MSAFSEAEQLPQHTTRLHTDTRLAIHAFQALHI